MLLRLNAVQMSVFGLGLSWVGTTRPSMAANRVNNRIEEALLIKVSLIKHPAVGQTVVNWHQALTMRPAVRRESKEYFYVFLIALFPDQLCVTTVTKQRQEDKKKIRRGREQVGDIFVRFTSPFSSFTLRVQFQHLTVNWHHFTRY